MKQSPPYKTPKVFKQFFKTYVWSIDTTNQKKIYLTFDDGPIPDVTEFVLKQLDSYNAKATFFCIGNNIQKNPQIFTKIIANGHAIGNHTMNHLKAWKSTRDDYLKDVDTCDQIIWKYYKNEKKLFRPPYGQISYSKFKTLEKLGYQIVLWDVLSKDWEQNNDPQDCYENILKYTEPGSIIVFHDSIKAWKNLSFILPKILEYYSKKGFVFEKIPL